MLTANGKVLVEENHLVEKFNDHYAHKYGGNIFWTKALQLCFWYKLIGRWSDINDIV